jgi:import receptor subunit TOM20
MHYVFLNFPAKQDESYFPNSDPLCYEFGQKQQEVLKKAKARSTTKLRPAQNLIAVKLILKRPMSGMDGKSLGIVAGIGAAAFLGYCVYFDNKRRSAPDFRAKLREKRRLAAKRANAHKGPAMPDFTDQEAVQRFFLQEVQLGEEMLAQGDLENGVEHLSLAVAVCGQPQSLLGVLQQTLPPQIFSLLLQNLDLAQKKVRSHAASSIPGITKKSGMDTEDVE